MKPIKIIVRIKSYGIGNILFQLAAANHFALELGGEILVDINDSTGEQLFKTINISQKFEVLNNVSKIIGLNLKVANKWEIFFASGLVFRGSNLGRFWEKLFGKILITLPTYINDKNGLVNKKLNSSHRKYYLDGYFQNVKYCHSVSLNARHNVSENSWIKNLLSDIKKTNSVSVHVRRGDYLALDVYEVHGLDFINKSISQIEDKIKDPYFYIFTDDVEWVKSNLKDLFHKSVLVSEYTKTSWDDFCLMINCKNNIISNSTFSWWAAQLNQNKRKIVVAPKKWYIEQSEQINSIVPRNWISI